MKPGTQVFRKGIPLEINIPAVGQKDLLKLIGPIAKKVVVEDKTKAHEMKDAPGEFPLAREIPRSQHPFPERPENEKRLAPPKSEIGEGVNGNAPRFEFAQALRADPAGKKMDPGLRTRRSQGLEKWCDILKLQFVDGAQDKIFLHKRSSRSNAPCG